MDDPRPADARQIVPVETGTLKESIGQHAEQTSRTTVVGSIGSNLDYSVFVAKGTKPHTIRGSPLAWEENGGMHFATVVHHPGTAPQPFIRPAIEIHRGDLKRLLGEALEKTKNDVS